MENIYSETTHLAEDVEDDPTSNDLTQQLHQLKTILANSTFDITEIIGKSINGEDFIEDELTACGDQSPKSNDENIEFVCEEEDGRISLDLAYERLPGIPQIIADQFALRTHTLDLSYNILKDLSFLSNFKILHTLILDNNFSINENTLPHLPSLRILWLNKCAISQLAKWMKRIRICTPNIRQLSLMGNPGVRSTLNGGSSLENYDYMMFVIRICPNLDYLDDMKITDGQRALARAYVNARALNGSPNNIRSEFSSTPNLLTIWKYDARTRRHHTKHGNVVPKLVLKPNDSQSERF